ncbi:MAG: AgmX/PglI C-terminal domain-containing protein, partial [Myxococcota bacterium]
GGGGAGDPVQTAVETAPPAPVLGANVVQHAAAEIAPRVQWRSSAIERAPMSLTAGDGSGLRLRSITGTVVIEDPLAFTELRLSFENPEARRREGRFEFDLPHSGALSRLAMKIGARWMEGEVVERGKGRRTFETFVHRRPRVDPALLEKAAANRVSARVFPILPRERKEIIVSYSQPLAGGHGEYRLPLQGLPELDALDVRVVVKTADAPNSDRFVTASQRVVEVRERDFAPDKDLVIALDGAGEAAGMRAEQLVAVRVRPAAAGAVDTVDSLAILFDTSASTARGFDREIDRLAGLLEALEDTPTRIVAFDQTVELVFDGPARDALGDALAGLQERRAFGASDLQAALRHDLITKATSERLLVWSDGVATAGATEVAALREAAGQVPMQRIDSYASSTSADRDLLTAMAAARPATGFVVGPDLRGRDLAAALQRQGFDQVEVAVPGSVWSYPRSLEGFAPGDDVVVYAGFQEAAPADVRVTFSDARLGDHVIPVLEGAAPLVERAVATARVAELGEELARQKDPAAAQDVRKRLLKLALSQRILTDHTALLVLESEAEYRRYGIDRSALTDILTVGPGGVDLLRRGTGPTGRALPPVDALVADARERNAGQGGILGRLQQESGHFLASPMGAAFAEDSPNEDVWGGLVGTDVGDAGGVGQRHFGEEGRMGRPAEVSPFAEVGGLGLVGSGRGGGGVGEGTIGLGNVGLIGKGGGGIVGTSGTGSGYGRGSGTGFGGRGKRVPRVRMAKATVQGALDRDIIRRIVRAHINEVRYCFMQGLQRDPDLDGRIAVQFTIGATGKVTASTVAEDTVGGKTVAACTAKAVKRWKFPRPVGGGTVSVRYPFAMSGDGGGWSASPRRARARRVARTQRTRRRGDPSDGPQWVGSAQSGRFASLQRMVADGRSADARTAAWEWASTEPDNALALVALGEMLEIEKRPALAARVYGSLIDLHPHRADMRRAAGARLEALDTQAKALALDSYRKAVAQRPDQINGQRLLAWALAKDKQYAEAFEVLTTALQTQVPSGRFNGVKALLREDRELVAAAWLASSDDSDTVALSRVRAAGVRVATRASLRLVADWETDATDVDILVDPMGPGDGRRHADVRTGFGPEAWIARGNKTPQAVTARVRYFDRGAMGYAMGTVSAIRHDGQGNLTFIDRPFVLMEAVGSVELGRFRA